MSEVKKETAEEVTAPAAEGICETNPELIIAEIKKKYKGGEVPVGSKDAKVICRLRRIADRSINHMTETAMPSRRLEGETAKKDKEIRQLRKQGLKYKEIAERLGLKVDGVRNYCNKHKILPPWGTGRRRKIDPAEAQRMREEGKTWRQIGEVFGVSDSTAMAAAKRYKEKEEDREWHGTQSG